MLQIYGLCIMILVYTIKFVQQSEKSKKKKAKEMMKLEESSIEDDVQFKDEKSPVNNNQTNHTTNMI